MNNKKEYKKKDAFLISNENKYEVVQQEITAGVGLHFHDYLEAELVLDGQAIQYINDYKTNLKKGSFTLLRPNIDCHSLEIEHLSVFKFYVKSFMIEPDLWKEISLLPNPLVIELEGEDLTFAINIFKSIQYEQSHHRKYTDEIVRNLINTLLYGFIRIKGSQDKNLGKRKNTINYLLEDDKYLTEVSLQDFADDFGYSLSHASKYFKENTGMTFSEAKQFFRIQYAKRLLLSTDNSINEISIMCGFNYYPLFNNIFKKSTGMTPFEFRKVNKES